MMAEIVDLAVARGQRQGRAHEPSSGPAQVVLYTGVRNLPAGPPPAPKKKRKPRHKH